MASINDNYDSRVAVRRAGPRWRSGLVKSGLGWGVPSFCALNLLLSASLESFAEERSTPSPAPIGHPEETNSPEAFRGILGVEGQLRSNQIAIEQNGKEAREAAAREAELLSKRLATMQEAFAVQQQALADRNARELQAMQSSNRAMVIVSAVACLAMLMVAYFQWRMSKLWAEISMALRISPRLGGASAVSALGLADGRAATALVEDSNSRLLRAMEQLETRVGGLEQISASAPGPRGSALPPAENGDGPVARSSVSTSVGAERPITQVQARISVLLGQGQSMLKKNEWEAAVSCFEEVLALEPNHGEALVKKGAALEGLKKWTEAFECYDRAIAANDSMTIAYLHKGGLCSRLERFKEALECYEMALRTHDEWSGKS